MAVNNGTHIGTLPSGTPYTGTVVFDDAQVVTPAPFSGGTQSVFTFTRMTFSAAGSTVSFGPGQILVHNNLTTNTSYPAGDSVYINIPSSVTTAVPPGGLIKGADFNHIFLGFVDYSGTAVTQSATPPQLNFGSFGSSFVEFNYGTLGQAWGAGNTSMLQFLSSVTFAGSGNPAQPPSISTSALPPGVVSVPYSAAITASAPNNDPISLSISGAPSGLALSGSAIAGVPLAVGTSNVTITATDTVTNLSTSVTLPLTINPAPITFAPTLPAGILNAAYSATFSPATGGSGLFSYSASGLPAGLSLTGNTVSGTPTAVGTYTVALTATDSTGASRSVNVPLTITAPVPVPCNGTNGVISAYVPRNPGFIVVNGGLNLLDHLWTSNLNPSNTTFVGGLINWFQTGLIVDWTGVADPAGCILTSLVVKPKVTINTAYLPNGVAGQAYLATILVSNGVAPYGITVAGLPGGLSFNGTDIVGTPTAVGTFNVAITAIDTVGATTTVTLPLTVIAPAISFAPVLPSGTVGTAYQAALSAGGFGPFTYTATGLPAGLTLNGSTIGGTPSVAGSFAITLTAKDAVGTIASTTATLVVNPATSSGNYTRPDEATGNITAIGADYLMVGAKKLIWNSATVITVNTPNGQINVINSFVKVGMKVQWKGLRDQATNTVLTSKIEIN